MPLRKVKVDFQEEAACARCGVALLLLYYEGGVVLLDVNLVPGAFIKHDCKEDR